MPVTTERIDGLPAVLATYDGLIKLDDIMEMFDDTARLVANVEGRYYRISDFRAAQSTFADIIQIMSQARSDKPGSTSDSNLTTIFVGSNEWGIMVRKFFEQAKAGAKDIPLVTTVEEAIEWIKENMR